MMNKIELSRSYSCVSLFENFSLEMTAKDIDQFEAAARILPLGTPISITFLPNEDFDGRVAAATAVRRAGMVPIPHISARRIFAHSDLDQFLARLVQEASVEHVFVVAGDLSSPAGPFVDSLSVIESGLLEKHGIHIVGVAGHPEGHPDVGADRLWDALEQKQGALADRNLEGYIATQFAFEAAPVANWLAEARRREIFLPVRVGVAGPASIKTLLRFAARCGVGASAKVMSRYGLSATKLLGTAGPERFLADLAANLTPVIHGDVRLHLYPFGGLLKTAQWIEAFQQ